MTIIIIDASGGINFINDKIIKSIKFNQFVREIYIGNKAKYDIPLICLPTFPKLDIKKDIYCSFMGRFDTHNCRMKMLKILSKDNKFKFWKSVDFKSYKQILNRSIFTLAPRGYGFTSFRLYEAIHANSIPIYIWEDKSVIPFSDILNVKILV